MTRHARLSLQLVATQAGWTCALLVIEVLVALAFTAAEGRPLDFARVVTVGLPPAACLGLCVTLSWARGTRLDVALSALGWRPEVVALPGVALAWLVCALSLDEAASPFVRRDPAAWRIEDTSTGRRVHSPTSIIELTDTPGGALRSDVDGQAARFDGFSLAPGLSAPQDDSASLRRWLAPGPPVAAAAWVLLATPTPIGWPLTLGVGAGAWLGAAALTAR